jgi:alpha-glucosidase
MRDSRRWLLLAVTLTACHGGDGGGAAGDGDILGDGAASSGDGAAAGDAGSDAGADALGPDDSHPPLPVSEGSPWTINSPDNHVVAEISRDAGGVLSYRVLLDGAVVIDATAIGLRTSLADFTAGVQFQSGATRVVLDRYAIPTGKRSSYVDHANELTLSFDKGGRPLELVVRAYDDGAAYRFGVPSGGSFTVDEERGGFKLPAGAAGWAAEMAPDYQGWWDARSAGELDGGEWEFPVLAKLAGGTFAQVTEASVYSTYFASHVSGSGAKDGLLRLVPGQSAVAVTSPFVTPWRAAIVGKTLAAIVESTLTENLNPPSELGDTSWIASGRSAWSWWSGDSTSDYATQVKYVDFAAAMGWEYYLCDEGWQASWMPKLVQYAAGKGVGIWLWISGDNMNSDAKIDANTTLWASWGIKGMKVDYVFGDSTTELAVYDKVARAAAQHKLMVNYHGCTKPSGERRRWPHLMTREAIFGAEQYKTEMGPTARFNCIVPFTRNVVGPMDYTPVTYSDVQGQTTAAHQTALDIVFESGVQHLADKPSSYQSNVAKALLAAVPAHWDETRLIEGEPAKFVTLARRSGRDWYLGAIGADAARTATIPLAFLGPGTYAADLYEDGGSDGVQAVEQRAVTAATTLSVALRKNGGFAARLAAP